MEVTGEAMKIKVLSDEEILENILEGYEEDGRLNMNYIDVEVADRSITLNGRVSSEEELQIIEEIMHDTLNIKDYNNKIWVDDTLTYEDHNDNSPDLKAMTFDDDEIDDQEYNDDEEEDEYN